MSVFNFHEHAVVIPMTVLEELDDIKDRKKNAVAEARSAIRMVDEVLGQSTLRRLPEESKFQSL